MIASSKVMAIVLVTVILHFSSKTFAVASSVDVASGRHVSYMYMYMYKYSYPCEYEYKYRYRYVYK